jgi:hypothetical protein
VGIRSANDQILCTARRFLNHGDTETRRREKLDRVENLRSSAVHFDLCATHSGFLLAFSVSLRRVVPRGMQRAPPVAEAACVAYTLPAAPHRSLWLIPWATSARMMRDTPGRDFPASSGRAASPCGGLEPPPRRMRRPLAAQTAANHRLRRPLWKAASVPTDATNCRSLSLARHSPSCGVCFQTMPALADSSRKPTTLQVATQVRRFPCTGCFQCESAACRKQSTRMRSTACGRIFSQRNNIEQFRRVAVDCAAGARHCR